MHALRTLTLLVACLGTTGCGLSNGTPAEAQPSAAEQLRAPALKVVAPQQRTLQHTIEQPGFVEAFEETPLVARIPGYVEKVNVDIGDAVQGPKDGQGGQVLAELSVPELEEEAKQKQALVKRAAAAVAQAEATARAAQAHVATAKAQVREAEAAKTRSDANYERWESEARRIEGLVRQKVIDEQTLDETRNQYKASAATRQEAEAKVLSAQAAVAESEAQHAKARADVGAAQAQVEVARAEARRADALLQYRGLRAPFDGVVTRRHVSTGHFVQPANGGSNQPLFVVARLDTVRVFVEVPEVEAAYVSEGMPAVVRVQALNNQELIGKVTRSSGSLDPKSRTLRVEVDLPNAERRLRPGMYAYVTLRAELKDRPTLPASAVTTQAGQPVCFVVANGKAVRTPVRLGLRDGGHVEVLAKQVRADDGSRWVSFTGSEAVLQGNLSEVKDGDAINAAP